MEQYGYKLSTSDLVHCGFHLAKAQADATEDEGEVSIVVAVNQVESKITSLLASRDRAQEMTAEDVAKWAFFASGNVNTINLSPFLFSFLKCSIKLICDQIGARLTTHPFFCFPFLYSFSFKFPFSLNFLIFVFFYKIYFYVRHETDKWPKIVWVFFR